MAILNEALQNTAPRTDDDSEVLEGMWEETLRREETGAETEELERNYRLNREQASRTRLLEERQRETAEEEIAELERMYQNSELEPEEGADTSGSGSAPGVPKIDSAQWFLMFSAAGFFWLIGLGMDLLIPFVTIVMNYCVVFALWFWAKTKGLKPPTFFSSAGKLSKLAAVAGPEAKAASSAAGALGQAPGSDIIYIGLGGITPIIYLSALWWNNR